MIDFKKMFTQAVYNLAPMAVKYVEDNYTGQASVDKKEFAIAFIVNKLPIPFYLIPFKGLIVKAIDSVVDEAIEAALRIVKKRTKLIDG